MSTDKYHNGETGDPAEELDDEHATVDEILEEIFSDMFPHWKEEGNDSPNAVVISVPSDWATLKEMDLDERSTELVMALVATMLDDSGGADGADTLADMHDEGKIDVCLVALERIAVRSVQVIELIRGNAEAIRVTGTIAAQIRL